MKIFVVNLDRSIDRRLAIFTRLQELGLSATRFSAVDGSKLSADEKGYNGLKRRLLFGKDLTDGEIGCARSHLQIYAMMEREGIELACILEDDAILDDDLPMVLEALETDMDGWDLVRFLAMPKDLNRARPIRDLGNGYRLCRIYGTPGGTYGYVINRRAAIRLVREGRSLWKPIDAIQGHIWSHRLRMRSIKPCPVAPDMENQSTIGDLRFDNRLKISGWERIAFFFTRPSYKIFNAVTKHGGRWLGIVSDKVTGREVS